MKDWDGLPLLIGGGLVQGAGPSLEVVNPATEQVIARVATADAAQANAAVAAARSAFTEGPWATMSGEDRREAIHRLADALDACADEMAECLVAELGTPVAIARSFQVGSPLQHLRHYAEEAVLDRTEDLGPHTDPTPSRSEVTYHPVGVVAAISAYNFPLALAIHKIGPALSVGCTVVLIPSPRTPLMTLLLARAVAESGLPPGVLNVVVGGADVARRLTEHPDVDKVAFTGSPEVGAAVMAQAASHLSGVVLELGGKSAAILLPDADLAEAVPMVHLRHLRNGGQACAAPTRILVPRERWDEFLARSREAYARIPVGDPADPATVIGPMIDAGHRARIEAKVAEAVAEGAEIAAGGGRPDLAWGYYMNPVLVVGVDNSWAIARDELFGPVAVAMPYDDIDEAVAIANDSPYGLHAYLYTADTDQARAIARRLRVGSVTINGGGGTRPDTPMGGFGISGVGREIGKWGIHEYLEPQHIQWRTS